MLPPTAGVLLKRTAGGPPMAREGAAGAGAGFGVSARGAGAGAAVRVV